MMEASTAVGIKVTLLTLYTLLCAQKPVGCAARLWGSQTMGWTQQLSR